MRPWPPQGGRGNLDAELNPANLTREKYCKELNKRLNDADGNDGADHCRRAAMIRPILKRYQDLLSDKLKHDVAFNKLKEVRDGSPPYPLSRRAAWYLHDIFPDGRLRCLPSPGKPLPKASITSEHAEGIRRAVITANEMASLKRFLEPENEWCEQGIFEKETAHAQRVENDPAWLLALESIFEDYKDLNYPDEFKFWAWSESEMGRHEEEYTDASDEESLLHDKSGEADQREVIPRELQFEYEMTCLCNAFMLRGVVVHSREESIEPIPQLFRIADGGHEVVLSIPSQIYLKLIGGNRRL